MSKMKIEFTKPNIKTGEIPDGTIVHVYFRIKTAKFDWAIYRPLEQS